MIVDKEMWPMPSYGDLMFDGTTVQKEGAREGRK